MADSSIAWLTGADGSKGRTWNPLAGCTPISPGCLNCYAATMAARLVEMGQAKYQGTAEFKDGRAKWTGAINLGDERDIDAPLSWKKPRMIFVNSMSDLFHEQVPDQFIDRVFVTMWNAQWHTFQVLTKRVERAVDYLGRHDWPLRMARAALAAMQRREPAKAAIMSLDDFVEEFKSIASIGLPNLLIGPSIENQKVADQRLPSVARLHMMGWRTMISAEPLLERVNFDMNRWRSFIDWLIVGGESGPHSRPCHVDWIDAVVSQCRIAGVRVFNKQLGARVIIRNDTFNEWPHEGDDLQTPAGWRPNHQGEDVEVRLANKKGEAMDEWPERLRVRQQPKPYLRSAS